MIKSHPTGCGQHGYTVFFDLLLFNTSLLVIAILKAACECYFIRGSKDKIEFRHEQIPNVFGETSLIHDYFLYQEVS